MRDRVTSARRQALDFALRKGSGRKFINAMKLESAQTYAAYLRRLPSGGEELTDSSITRQLTAELTPDA